MQRTEKEALLAAIKTRGTEKRFAVTPRDHAQNFSTRKKAVYLTKIYLTKRIFNMKFSLLLLF